MLVGNRILAKATQLLCSLGNSEVHFFINFLFLDFGRMDFNR